MYYIYTQLEKVVSVFLNCNCNLFTVMCYLMLNINGLLHAAMRLLLHRMHGWGYRSHRTRLVFLELKNS